MKHLYLKISGMPYGGGTRTRGNKEGPGLWTEAIIDQTKNYPKVKEACILRVTFLLPEDRFPTDFPYGPDLDNLLKRFLDALNKTIFLEAPGKDSCVISLTAQKVKIYSKDGFGALLEILPVSING